MPGISGLVTGSPRSMDRAESVLHAFEQVHALKGVSFAQKVFQSERCVISNTLKQIAKGTLEQPSSDARGRTHLFLDGEVYNTKELLEEAKEPLGSAPCNVLLALFLERGPEFVSLLDGCFNVVIYQEDEERLTIVNDLVSGAPLYYKEENGSLLFGSEKKSILAAMESAPALDPLGLLQVFAHRHNLSGRTYLEGLHRLPPGSHLDFRDGKLTVRCYRRLQINVPRSLPSAAALLDEWCERLKASAVKRVRGKERILISLSGGLDSRAVTCALPRELRPLWARTRGAEGSLEVICAKQVAERLGIHLYREDPSDVPYSEILPKVVWRTEGEVTFRNGLTMASHDKMKAHGDFIYGGQFGDAATGAHIYPYMLVPRSRESFIERAFRWYQLYPDSMLRRVFSQDLLEDNLPALKDAFVASFEVHEGDNNIMVYQMWDLLERQARMTLGAGPVDSHLFDKLYPFVGRDNLEFILALPNRLRFGQCLYQAMIYQLGPEVRDVPNANTNKLLSRSVTRNVLEKILLLSGKAVTKVLRRAHLAAPEPPPAARGNLASATRSDPEFRRVIEGFLHSDSFDSAVFNREGISKLLEEHYRGACDRSELLSLVATFAVALPYFLYHRPAACPEEAQPLTKQLV